MKLTRFYPTWRWGVCLVVSLAILFAAFNYQKNALHWLAYTCMSLMVYTTVYSWAVNKNRTWLWQQPHHVFATQQWSIHSNVTGPGVFFGGDLISQSNTVTSPHPGVVTLKSGYWVTEYPLGLFRIRFKLPHMDPVWVYPQPVNHRAQGDAPDVEWTKVRTYQNGDSTRLLLKKTQSLPPTHWQVRDSAPGSKTRSEAVYILDWERLPAQWSADKKLQQLSFDIDTMRQHDVFDLALPTGSLGPGRGVEHQHQAWQALTEYAVQLKQAS